jgi:hypothetical protein
MRAPSTGIETVASCAPATTGTLALRAAELGERAFAVGVASCTAAFAAFVFVHLTYWPPHEDETLALFVGRGSLGHVLSTVLGERGGAPLHFLLAWTVVHLGGSLDALRFCSALFAVASIPVIALLASRLAGRTAALAGTALAAGSWILLFHGIYGRMYSLFLLTSALSYLAMWSALESGGRRRFALWALSILATVATHPYGAVVLASQGLYVLAARRRLREALVTLAAVGVVGIPFWRTDLVLAGRFDVHVGGRGSKLGSPIAVLQYLYHVAADFSTGNNVLLVATLLVAGLGLWRLATTRREGALLAGIVVATPAVALMAASLGSETTPESRHLIFILPLFATMVGAGLATVASRRVLVGRLLLLLLAVGWLLHAELAWGRHKTPAYYRGEKPVRVEARQAASAWLAETSRADDVLFGYSPLFLGAWQRNKSFSDLVVPRADGKLALSTLRSWPQPLGRGIWVFDASSPNNFVYSLTIELRSPEPEALYEARVFGPFLVIRSRRPAGNVKTFLKQSEAVMQVGRSLYIGDADVNLHTVLVAEGRLARLSRKPS